MHGGFANIISLEVALYVRGVKRFFLSLVKALITQVLYQFERLKDTVFMVLQSACVFGCF